MKGGAVSGQPAPQRGAGWPETAWAGFWGRAGDDLRGDGVTAGQTLGRRVRGPGDGVGRRGLDRTKLAPERRLRKAGNRRGRLVAGVVSRPRRRASMGVRERETGRIVPVYTICLR